MLPYIIAVVVLAVTCYFVLQRTRKTTCALDPSRFKKFKLIQRTQVSHDSFIFRFALDKEDQVLGLPIGQHITLRGPCEREDKQIDSVQHAYTPISSDDDRGHVDFLIKVYFAHVHPKFPRGGRLSQHVHQLRVGDTLEMRGPQGKLEYAGNGHTKVHRARHGWSSVYVDAYAMVAGGTGITPMMQIIRAIHKNKSDKTKVFLVYGNQTEKDILLREELDQLARDDPERIHVWYTVDREVTPGWAFDTGYVSEDMFRKHLPVPSQLDDASVPQNKGIKKVMGLMCGPPPMVQYAIRPNLEKLGYTSDAIFAF